MENNEPKGIELVFATTGAIGANVGALRDAIKEQMCRFAWQSAGQDVPSEIMVKDVHIVKLMHKFLREFNHISAEDKSKINKMVDNLEEIQNNNEKKYQSTVLHQDLGDILRRAWGKDFLARLAIKEINEIRRKKVKRNDFQKSKDEKEIIEIPHGCVIYLVHSLKHVAEAELLRQVYRESFFLFGAFMEEERRKERWMYKLSEATIHHAKSLEDEEREKNRLQKQLDDVFFRDYSRKKWDQLDEAVKRDIRSEIEEFWENHGFIFVKNYLKLKSDKTPPPNDFHLYKWISDYEPDWGKYTQNMKTLLPISDVIIHTYPATLNDKHNVDTAQLNRVLQLLFGDFHHTPTNEEHGLFMAYSAMLHSGDLGRQVGAVITNDIGDVLAIGYNEVPCFGGLCSETNFPENRDFREKQLSHRKYLDEVINDLSSKSDKLKSIKEVEKFLADSKIEDAIEHFRSVHAEMGAIVNAAKSGQSIKDGIMYVTTLPCHLCMSHIIASGIKRVVYLEPYEKSHGAEYYKNSIALNPTEEEKSKIIEENKTALARSKVIMEHFTGVLPNRYRNLFFYDTNRFDKKVPDKSKPKAFNDQNCQPHFRIHGSFLTESPYRFWEQHIVNNLDI